MPLKILCTSDIHLGRRSSWLPDHTPEASVRHAWQRIISLAVDQQVDVLALAGDIVDQDNSYFEASGPLQEGFSRLAAADIEVFVVSGNHDYQVLAQLLSHNTFPHVHLLGRGGRWERHTLERHGLQVAFLGWSFPARFVRTDPVAELTQMAQQNITIGLLHGDVDSAGSIYAPLSLSVLQAAPAQAWVIGHIHKQEVLSHNPLIFYPGSPQALSPKETGTHGVVMLTVADHGEISHQLIPLSSVRYATIRADVSAATDQESFKGLVNAAISHPPEALFMGAAHLLLDVELCGHSPASHHVEGWKHEIGQFESAREGCSIRVRKVINSVKPFINLEDLAGDPSPAGKLAQTILALEKGETTGFTDQIVRQWLDKAAQTRNSSTYSVLPDTIAEPTHQQALEVILKECRQLLGQLLETREVKA